MNNASALHEAINMATVMPGYWDDVPLPLGSIRNSSMLTLTAGTTPIIEVSSNQARIRWAAGDAAAVNLGSGIRLPRNASPVEVDPVSKRSGVNLAVDAVLSRDANANTITMSCSIYFRRPGTSTQMGPLTVTQTLGAGTAPTELSFPFLGVQDASGNQLYPGDVIEQMTLTPSAHAGDAVYLTGASIRYKRNVGYCPFSIRYRT